FDEIQRVAISQPSGARVALHPVEKSHQEVRFDAGGMGPNYGLEPGLRGVEPALEEGGLRQTQHGTRFFAVEREGTLEGCGRCLRIEGCRIGKAEMQLTAAQEATGALRMSRGQSGECTVRLGKAAGVQVQIGEVVEGVFVGVVEPKCVFVS